MSTITVRVIKSFEYRTVKALVLHDVPLDTMTAAELTNLCRERIKTAPGFMPYRTCVVDTLKIHQLPHGAKTSNPVINLDHDEWELAPDVRLAEFGVVAGTELSLYKKEDYETFRANPKLVW